MTKAAEQKTFRDALKSGQFAPAYYFHGGDDYLKEEAVRQLLSAVVEPTTRAFNLDQQKGSDVQAELLDTLLATPPLMAARRVVVIRDVEALRKDARLILDRFLGHPSPETILVLVAGTGAKADRHLSMKATAVEYPTLSGSQLPKWIIQEVERNGGTITDGAVTLLQDVGGADLTQLALELEKLASYMGNDAISEAAVTAMVGVRREETLGHLLDAVAIRDAFDAMRLLPIVLQQPKSSAVTIVMALTVQTLALAWAEARGLHAGRASREFFGLLKDAGSVYTGRAWGEAVSAWTEALPRWTAADLDQSLTALNHADEVLKESRLSSDVQLLSTLILTLCNRSASQWAA
jgi:DNA polymerase III subunit delta